MKLAYDARLAFESLRGMGRYTRQLIAPIRGEAIGLTHRQPNNPTTAYQTAGWGFFPLWEQFTLPQLARSSGANWLLCPYNTGPIRKSPHYRTITVVHDLIFLEPLKTLPASRSPYQNFGRLYRRLVVPRAINASDKIITVSQYTRDQLVNRLLCSPKRIKVIPNSIGEHWFTPNAATPNPLPYILTVSGEAPSKNLERLIRGFAAASSELPANLTLRIAGVSPHHHEAFKNIAKKAGAGKRVTLENRLTDDALKQLYFEASAFIFPSLFEGFGIPLLEALAAGLPAASSNRTSLPEVGGNQVHYFDPLDINQIATAIKELANTPGEIKASRSCAARKQASQYRESKIAQEITSFWQEIFDS